MHCRAWTPLYSLFGKTIVRTFFMPQQLLLVKSFICDSEVAMLVQGKA
jgi:hypothetical protein